MGTEFKKLKKKFLIDAIIKSVIIGVSAGLFAAGAVWLGLKLAEADINAGFYVLIGLGVAAAVGGGLFFILRPSDTKIAKTLDRENGLNEKVQTMVAFSGREGEMLELQRQDASEKLSALPKRKFDIKKLWQYILIPVLALAVFITAAVIPQKKPDIPPDIPFEYTERHKAAVEQLIEDVDKTSLSDTDKSSVTALLRTMSGNLEKIKTEREMKAAVISAVALIDVILYTSNSFDNVAFAIGGDEKTEFLSAAITEGVLFYKASSVTVTTIEQVEAMEAGLDNSVGEKVDAAMDVFVQQYEISVSEGLYIDGDSRAAATVRVVVPVYQKTPFEINADYTEFSNIKVAITNRDALALDNEVIIYSPEAETQYKALIVSDAPYFLQSALATKNNTETTVVSLKDYKSSVSGYDLYIFDGVTGAVMPRDGAVWFIDPKDSVSGSGFTFQGNVSLAEGQKLTYSSSSASALDLLRRNLLKNDIYVKEYTKCGLYRKFSTLLTHDGNPLLFAGTNSYGSRELVVAFDLHKSNLPVTADYTTLIGNMFSYTFPNAFEKTSYVCGETVRLNVPAKCNSIRVDSPMENVSYLGTGGDECELYLSEAGLYTVTMLAGGSERKFYIFAELPENERIPVVAEEAFSVRGEPSEAGKSGTYEDLLAWFILLAVLAAADWGVYCYEQYQLR